MNSTPSRDARKRVVIIGAGWAGFSAASTLASSTLNNNGNTNLDIVLLDASPRGKGGLAGGWRTPSGRPVEAGIHGFWREYKNTFQVIEGIESIKSLDDVLTPYTPSVLVSQSGRVALAPVLGDDNTVSKRDLLTDINPIINSVAKLLPPPLDLALVTIPAPSSPLSNFDRLSALNLLPSWADFQQEDPKSWSIYDSLSAEDLFLTKAGISKPLYQELVSPLLHVLPMAPGYDCSAAAALSCFHVFALQNKGAFDVRWCRGSITEKIFNPWSQDLVQKGVDIRGGTKVVSIDKKSELGENDYKFELKFANEMESIQCDSIIFAVGATAIGKIAESSPGIFDSIPIAKTFPKLRGITCVAVRLFLKASSVTSDGLYGGQHGATELPNNYANAMKDSPVLVCGENIGKGTIPQLKETGFCVYDLQRLQDEFAIEEDSDNTCAVIEMDFFRADLIADLNDEEVIDLSLKALSLALELPVLARDSIIDFSVVRARNAVSHFAINSASYSPSTTLTDGVHICGDWVDRVGHASWSTEKAVVTGRQAANAALKEFGKTEKIRVLNVVEDTPSLKSLREIAKNLRQFVPPKDGGVPGSPWAFIRDLVKSN